MTGRRLNRLTRSASPRDRALVAVNLARGALQLTELTLRQAAVLARASFGYTATVNGLAPEERTQLARGSISLCRLHLRHRHSNAELDRVVQTYGIDALWRALDRATAPTTVVEAAEQVT
jgi:hypothetical protein